MKKRKLLVVFLVVFTVLLSSFALYTYQVIYTPNVLVDKRDQILYIEPHMTFKDLQNTLYEKDYVQDLVSFSFLARLMKYDQNIKPGRYLLRSDMTNIEAIRMLRGGLQEPTEVTFNNVRTETDLAEKICDNLEMTETEFLEYLNDPANAKKYGFDTTSFFTMFLPDSYEVYWNISVEGLFERMHKEYRNFWTEKRLKRARTLGMTPDEVTVLASIVEAETQKSDESARVAGVYINRLKKNIALQADPTLIHALGDYSIKRVLNEHKQIDSPYNTYRYRGLPPGPINLPPKRTIDAVLNYEDHNYLYFCAKPDFSGYHSFARTLTEHNRNAALWQRALNKAKIYR